MRIKREGSRVKAGTVRAYLRERYLREPVCESKQLTNRSCFFIMKIPKKPHIGKLLREYLRKNGHTVVWLKEQLDCDRAKLYRIFANSDIYSDDLWQIAAVVNHDFFLDLSRKFSQSVKDETKV